MIAVMAKHLILCYFKPIRPVLRAGGGSAAGREESRADQHATPHPLWPHCSVGPVRPSLEPGAGAGVLGFSTVGCSFNVSPDNNRGVPTPCMRTSLTTRARVR